MVIFFLNVIAIIMGFFTMSNVPPEFDHGCVILHKLNEIDRPIYDLMRWTPWLPRAFLVTLVSHFFGKRQPSRKKNTRKESGKIMVLSRKIRKNTYGLPRKMVAFRFSFFFLEFSFFRSLPLLRKRLPLLVALFRCSTLPTCEDVLLRSALSLGCGAGLSGEHHRWLRGVPEDVEPLQEPW